MQFYIGDNLIPSIAKEEQKFLGKVIFFSGKSKDTVSYIKETFETKLKNIEETKDRTDQNCGFIRNISFPPSGFYLRFTKLQPQI